MAGLLTFSVARRLPGSGLPVAIGSLPATYHETYSSGTVQDLHLIPFNYRLRTKTVNQCIAKIRKKVISG